jgi:hypothetical protein
LKLRYFIILLAILLALGGYFYFTSRPEPEPEPEPQTEIWSVEPESLQHIEIRLPREGESQAFVKIQEAWYFDDPQKSSIDGDRWGGITTLLSSPGATRVIAEDVTEEKLAEFGLVQAQMEIVLTLENGESLYIKIGDSTPDSYSYYTQFPNSNDVATIDYSFYWVVERLVKEPPYATSEEG